MTAYRITATTVGGARPTIGATIRPSTSQAAIVSTSTDRLVRWRPTIVMNPRRRRARRS